MLLKISTPIATIAVTTAAALGWVIYGPAIFLYQLMAPGACW